MNFSQSWQCLNAQVKCENRASKLIRTLPESFLQLVLVAETTDLPLEKLMIAIEGDITGCQKSKLLIAKRLHQGTSL